MRPPMMFGKAIDRIIKSETDNIAEAGDRANHRED